MTADIEYKFTTKLNIQKVKYNKTNPFAQSVEGPWPISTVILSGQSPAYSRESKEAVDS